MTPALYPVSVRRVLRLDSDFLPTMPRDIAVVFA